MGTDQMANNDDQRERKTSTILAMDVVGYSEKMGSDEEGTVRQLEVCRGIVEETVASHQGRVFNVAGDAFMVEFNSTLSAVKSGIAIQEKVASHNEGLDSGKGLEFRMGINMGDVVVDGDNLLGEGVNVAARLEGIAPSGGICISDIVHSVVKGKVSCGFIDQGEQDLKNINEPVKAYYADIKTGSVDPKKFKYKASGNKAIYLAVVASVTVAVGLYIFQGMQSDLQSGADFQRIAILPLDAGSDEQAMLNLATGLTQDLSTNLSTAAKKLTIVTLSEPPNDLNSLYEDIGTRYFINGTIRKAGSNIRISVNLTDTSSMATIWTKKYDKEFTAANIFSLQDEIVTNVIDSLVGNGAVLAQEVAKNFSATGTQNLNAYECVNFVRGQYFKVLSPVMHTQGLDCLRKAVKDDPEYKEAWALLGHMLAWGYSLYQPFFQAVDKAGLSEAFEAVDNAIRIDKNYARAYATRAELHFYEGDWDQLMVNAERALELAPGDAYSVGHLSYITVLSGFGCKFSNQLKVEFDVDDKACERLEWGYQRALLGHQLDAISSLSFDNYGLGLYYWATSQWQKQLANYQEVPAPDFHWWNMHIGMAYHHLGNREMAKQHFDAVKIQYLSVATNPISKIETAYNTWGGRAGFGIEVPRAKEILKSYGWD